MGSKFKIGLYVFVIVMVGILFGVRVYNTLQKTNYVTETIFENGDAQISLHYPARILSPRNETSYPLTISFNYTGDVSSPHTYEISLQSLTLLFVDAKGTELTPRFQFTSGQTYFEQSVYVRPYLSETYPNRHVIDIHVLADGQEAQNSPAPIEIQTEAWWFSFFSLAAASLLEIGIVSALIGWAVNAIDASSTARKERAAKIREELNGLSALPYLMRMDKVGKLQDQVENEHLDSSLADDIKRHFFTEAEFFRALGEQLQKNIRIDFPSVQKLHNRFYPLSNHKDSMETLGKILDQESVDQEDALLYIDDIMRIWDDFDADSKDLIIGALQRLTQKVDLPTIPATELLTQVFVNDNRRRLLRDTEISALFSQLSFLPPVGYNAKWLHLPNLSVNPRAVNWLKQHNLIANPLGTGDFKNSPFYPEGFLPPDQWDDFLPPLLQTAQCPTAEDAKALAFLLCSACLPIKKVDAQGNETATPGKQAFPVGVSFEQTAPLELPLITLARSAARAWMEVLPFSPDAMLDLVPANQVALVELLCWVFGSNNAVVNLLKRANLKDDNASARLLVKKIEEFKTEFSSAHLPQDSILLSWMQIRPPDLNYTYLILSLDEFRAAVRTLWLEQFTHLISTLFLHGIVTKAFFSSHIPVMLPISAIRLSWSDLQLKKSLDSQFSLAVEIDKETSRREKEIKFNELFGPFGSVSEKDTTHKLISASHNSLSRMLTLGNRLLETHCEQEVPTPYLSVAELETILKSA